MKLKKSTKNFLTTLTIALLLTISLYNVAYAYWHVPGTGVFPNQYNIQIKWQWNNGFDFSPYLNQAVGGWNSSAARILFNPTQSITESKYVKINDYYFGTVGWAAKAYPLTALNPNVSDIQINDTYALDSAWASYYNKSELIAHELGHVLRLGDETMEGVLMYYTGYKGSHTPEQDDIWGVNAIYK